MIPYNDSMTFYWPYQWQTRWFEKFTLFYSLSSISGVTNEKYMYEYILSWLIYFFYNNVSRVMYNCIKINLNTSFEEKQ